MMSVHQQTQIIAHPTPHALIHQEAFNVLAKMAINPTHLTPVQVNNFFSL